jgi:hypothetical protein
VVRVTRWQKRAQAIDWVVGEHLLKSGELYGEWTARYWAANAHSAKHGLWSEDQAVALVRDEMEREIDAQLARKIYDQLLLGALK